MRYLLFLWSYVQFFSEAPEEEPEDRRCLYDRLQEQKDKKQADFDEQHKLSKQFFD